MQYKEITDVKRVEVILTDEQFAALAQLSYDSTRAYGEYIPMAAVIMAASMRGMTALRYELESLEKNKHQTIRLVK